MASSPEWQQLISNGLTACLVVVGLLAIVGAIIVGRGGRWFLSMYFGLTILLVLLTPWQSQFWRYLAPLAPLSLIFLATALAMICCSWGALKSRGSGAAILLPSVVLTAMLLLQIAIAVPFLRNLMPVSYYDASGRERVLRLLTYEPHWHALDRAFEWVRQNAPANAVIATTVPQLAYLRSGHKSVLPPLHPDPEQASRLLDQVPVSFLILDQLGRPPISDRYAAPVISHRPEEWSLAYTAPDNGAKVYRRVR
jgi:hypothetical protein